MENREKDKLNRQPEFGRDDESTRRPVDDEGMRGDTGRSSWSDESERIDESGSDRSSGRVQERGRSSESHH